MTEKIPIFNIFFFFNDTATTEIYTLSLHDALPILLPPVPSTERAMPSSPEEFREFAQECLRWAGETKSERHRQALLETARTWIQAALEVERSGLRRNAHFANLGPAR